MNVVMFAVVLEDYNTETFTCTVERTFTNVMAATNYIRRHRDELRKGERFGLQAITDGGTVIALH